MAARNSAIVLDVEAQDKPVGDWDETWDLGRMPRLTRIKFGILSVLVALVLLLVIPMVFTWSSRVPSNNNAVIVFHDGSIASKAAGPGRRFHGPSGKAVLFPRFDGTIEYAGEDPVLVRVEDGQIVSIDLSFQYYLPKQNLVNIYRLHKESFGTTLRQLARAILRDEAAKYRSTAFFSNRTQIAAEMRRRMENEGQQRQIEITGFQIRGVTLPARLVDNLFNVQRQRLDVRSREEQLILEQVDATTNALALQLRTARNRGIAEFDQGTAVLLAHEIQNRSRIDEQTLQRLAQIGGTTNETVTLFQQQTASLVEEVRQNITVETELTRREVDRIQHESETNLTVYNQETDNLRLLFDNNVTLINEQTRQIVNQIRSNTTRAVRLHEARLRTARAYALAEARVVIAEVTEASANQTVVARQLGYSGLPSAVFLAETLANGTLPKARFYDANLSSMIDLASQ